MPAQEKSELVVSYLMMSFLQISHCLHQRNNEIMTEIQKESVDQAYKVWNCIFFQLILHISHKTYPDLGVADIKSVPSLRRPFDEVFPPMLEL